jgi:hypothetical protein
MRRKAIIGIVICMMLGLGLMVVRSATRNRAEQLDKLPGLGGILTTGTGPFAFEDHVLVLSGSQLQLVDQHLKSVDTFSMSSDVVRLSASRDLSIAAALEYRRFGLVNTKTRAQSWHGLDRFSTEIHLSPRGDHLWVGEYESGVMNHYALTDVHAVLVRSVNIKEEAKRIVGPPRLIGAHDFRVVGVLDDGTTTILHSDAHEALLIYDWRAGRSVGSVPLPSLNSHPAFVQSPAGDRLAIVANRLVLVDLKNRAVVVDRELGDYSRAGDFNGDGDRFFIAYSAPAMLAIPLMHRGGQIDEFDLQGDCLKTWHSGANRIRDFGARGSVAWMVTEDGVLQTIRLPE